MDKESGGRGLEGEGGRAGTNPPRTDNLVGHPIQCRLQAYPEMLAGRPIQECPPGPAEMLPSPPTDHKCHVRDKRLGGTFPSNVVPCVDGYLGEPLTVQYHAQAHPRPNANETVGSDVFTQCFPMHIS